MSRSYFNYHFMKKAVLLLMTAAGLIPAMAQVPDSVAMGPAYANKVFYSMAAGEVGQMTYNNWDIAVAVYGIQTASVRINGGFGAQLFQYDGGDTTAWASLDTAGLMAGTDWKRCYDSDTSFEPSAFEYFMTGHPNYGWGVYNSVTHNVVGVKLFVLKTVSGGFKKVWIKGQESINNTMTIRVANLDNSSDTTVTFSKSYTNKNYVYLALSNMQVNNPEPDNTTYDITFQKYEAYVMPPGMYYPVTGVWSNQDVLVAEARNIHEDDAQFGNYTFTDNMGEIGYDWKIQPPPAWTIVDSLSYFVQTPAFNIYQIWFTRFDGSSTGKAVFNVRQIAAASVEDEGNIIGNFTVYPNPVSDRVNILYSMEQNYADGTCSITDLNGRELYKAVLGNGQGLHTHSIDVRSLGLTSGIYLVRLQVGTSNAVQKLIVQ